MSSIIVTWERMIRKIYDMGLVVSDDGEVKIFNNAQDANEWIDDNDGLSAHTRR